MFQSDTSSPDKNHPWHHWRRRRPFPHDDTPKKGWQLFGCFFPSSFRFSLCFVPPFTSYGQMNRKYILNPPLLLYRFWPALRCLLHSRYRSWLRPRVTWRESLVYTRTDQIFNNFNEHINNTHHAPSNPARLFRRTWTRERFIQLLRRKQDRKGTTISKLLVIGPALPS